MNCFSIFSIIFILGACKNITNEREKVFFEKSLSIDLVDLKTKNLLIPDQITTVNNDPVYHRKKSFNTVDLLTILKNYSLIDSINAEEYKVVFECEDGYKPEMNLSKLLNSKAFLAISDTEAPKGEDFAEILKDGHKMKAAPFYIVYENVDSKDGSYKWPYNLVEIHIEPVNNDDSVLKPENAPKAMIGYEVFINKCITCHAINGIGGEMGPELNYPKSITEYWKTTDLKAFIRDPSSYRKGVKMPKLEINEKDADDLVNYLTYMAGHKL